MRKKKSTKRGRKKRTQYSTLKNVVLLLVSLGLLTGASMLFSYLGNRSDISLDPIQKAFNGIVTGEEKADAPAKLPETKTGLMGGYDYEFYDLLSQKDDPSQSEEHYSIQIGAFKKNEHAKEFVRELNERARISLRIDRDGKLNYVRWGTFTTRESAEKQCAKLSDKLQRKCVVVKM
ncbi:MAG TPA: SPOR domain-containing protein [Deltaproteobacteria bacterium]|nr:SPOR domain-containing protein [Deltaproteobacteria bacterium]HPR53778.1 SPOR domain-containing protein [Deltaproteobacteria bacterium]HXK46795.1 SPOR domain-containing protein [Deltaproteobacteria bacterium]